MITYLHELVKKINVKTQFLVHLLGLNRVLVEKDWKHKRMSAVRVWLKPKYILSSFLSISYFDVKPKPQPVDTPTTHHIFRQITTH